MSTSLYCLRLYNFLTDTFTRVSKTTGQLVNAVCNYLNGTSNEWYFVDSVGVIPAVSYKMPTREYKDRIQWTYNAFRNTLIQNYTGQEPLAVRCRWLSAQLVVGDTTYTLDDWLDSLYIVVERYSELTVGILVDAWSVHHGIWPPGETDLQIIDNEGELHTFNINADLTDEWLHLLPQQKVTEPYVESEEDETPLLTEPLTPSVFEPIPEPVLEPVLEPVTEPVPEPVPESVLEPVTEPVLEPVAEPLPVSPVSEPMD